jgi:hypothetical protein
VDDAATAAATKTFLEKFAQRAPSTMAPPSFPTEFRARPPRGGAWQRALRSTWASPKPASCVCVCCAPRRLLPRACCRSAVPKAAAAGATPDKVTLNFYLPHSIEFQGQKVRLAFGVGRGGTARAGGVGSAPTRAPRPPPPPAAARWTRCPSPPPRASSACCRATCRRWRS